MSNGRSLTTGQSLGRIADSMRRKVCKGKKFVIASLIPLASSFRVFIIMRQDELPLVMNYLLSTTKTAAPRGMLFRYRVRNFLSCSRASEKPRSDIIEHNLDP